MAGSGEVHVRIAQTGLTLYFDDLGNISERGDPLMPIDFDFSRVINGVSENLADAAGFGPAIAVESIGCKLETAQHSGLQIAQEILGGFKIPLIRFPVDDELAVAVNGQEREEITASNIIFSCSPCFASDNRVDFIRLDKSSSHITHFSVQQSGALLAHRFKDAQDCAPVKSCEAFTSTDAHSLTEQVDHLTRLVKVHPQSIQRL